MFILPVLMVLSQVRDRVISVYLCEMAKISGREQTHTKKYLGKEE